VIPPGDSAQWEWRGGRHGTAIPIPLATQEMHMKKLALFFSFGLLFVSAGIQASDDGLYYEVTVTNLTRGQSFTPILVATHRSGVKLFTLGQAASPELALLAEGGDTGPLTGVLGANPDVHDVITIPGLLDPGKSVTARVKTKGNFRNVSVAAMLIPTNDGFFALNDVRGPYGNRTRHLRSPAYDAGSEPNDESCLLIPGPVCGGEGPSPGAGGEDYVHIHAGIHGIGDLVAADRDWRNPVASISIKRVH
jgi:hypothetical protein